MAKVLNATRTRTDGRPKQSVRKDNKPDNPPGVKREKATNDQGEVTAGQPHVVIDEAALYEAAKTHASYEQLGRIFGVGGQTLIMNYKELILKARDEAKKNLLAAQFQTAINDRNPTMQIWLGKQYLGQKDVQRTEHSGPDGKPIQTEKTKRVVAYFPGNGRRRPVDGQGREEARATG